MHTPEGLWKETIETLPAELSILNTEGTIVYTNRQWAAFGRENGLSGEAASSLGENYVAIAESADDEYAQATVAGLREILAGERSQFSLEYPCHSTDQRRWFRLLASALEVEGDRYVVVEHLNITDRKLAELTVTEKNDRLEALYAAAQDLLQVDSRREAADVAVHVVDRVLDLPVVGLWLYDADADVLEPAATTETAEAVVGDHPTYRSDESLSWRAFSEGEPYVFDDLSTAPDRHNPDSPLESEIILPLGSYGVINVGGLEPNAFDETDVTLAELWALTVTNVLSRLEREEELREREAELTHERDRLEQFAGLVSHDLRNPLNVATGRLELATEECDSEHLDVVERALDRMERLIEDLLTLAREGDTVGETNPVAVATLVAAAWETVETPAATLTVDTDLVVRADESRLVQVFENLFRNAVEHGGESVAVTVSDLEEAGGFYVEDDGPGIPPERRDQVFESGVTTSADGTGFGLAIVQQILAAHGWDCAATESQAGGARFEVTGVDPVTD